MRVQLFNIDTSIPIFKRTYQDNFQSIEDDGKNIVHQINHSDNSIQYTEITLEGIHIGYGNRQVAGQQSLLYQSTIENIEMHFALGGSSTSFNNSITKIPVLNFNPNQHNIIYSKEVDSLYTYEGPDFRFFEVKVKPELFLKHISGDDRLLTVFQEIILSGKFSLIQKENRNITLPMLNIINNIINCVHTGIFKKMFLEAKVLELLMHQLEQFIETEPEKTSKKNLEKIYAIRDFIAENISSTYSLIDLAHMVGTNEFALKKGFKEVFGSTVFGYWHQLKMEEAKRMLLDTPMNVTEVAEAIGYVNARHFSTAFKKTFGLNPGKLKD